MTVKIKELVPHHLDTEEFQFIEEHLNEPLQVMSITWDRHSKIRIITVYADTDVITLFTDANMLSYEFVDAPHWLR